MGNARPDGEGDPHCIPLVIGDYPASFTLLSPCRLGRRGGGLRLFAWVLVWLLSGLAAVAAVGAELGPILGLPFSRSYSFEEIGNVSRGARLGFDSLGRLVVIHQGSYVVLNDNTWTDLLEKSAGGVKIQQVVFDAQGTGYFGAFGCWGKLEFSPEGLMRPRPLLPQNYPKWVLASNFMDVLVASGGVYFASFNGVAYWDRATGEHTFFEVPQMSRIFSLYGAVYVWSHRIGIQRLDLAGKSLHAIDTVDYSEHLIDQVIVLDEHLALVATMAGRLMIFDGTRMTPWLGPLSEKPNNRISALQRLVDGSVAIAISGRGLYIVSASGEILSSYTSPEYHRIIELAAREAGVLWAETENGVEKVLYDSALTVFGQRVGLPISWPQVTSWMGRVVVASGGRLYETVPGATGEPARFELIPNQPPGEIWALAAMGDRLIAGGANGAFAREPDGRFTPILPVMNVARLVMISPELCFAIGSTEIVALGWADGRWSERTARVAGVGYPSVVMGTKQAAWLELAANRVARVSLRAGQVRVESFESFPWEPLWINVGHVGDTVILAGGSKGRVYYDETKEAFVPAPPLERLLSGLPFPTSRVREDDKGALWVSYEQGLLMLRPNADGPLSKPVTFSFSSDRFPFIYPLPGGDVWTSTGQSLYRVDRRRQPQAEPAYQPQLVSVVDSRTRRELVSARHPDDGPLHLEYEQNILIFRFFSGSYASRRTPTYEFKLNRGPDTWAPLAAGSLLTLNDLREGSYRLAVRLTGAREPIGEKLDFEFVIAPPWYRTWYAYSLYALGGISVVLALIRISVWRTRSRNLVLEKLVHERTDELRAAMQQLNEETRNAATVAERNRLAGEIHDSLQQGLSGLILQLDATLKLPGLSPDVRQRLNVARNMVSFTRHEVQHAVWDMESPLLDDAELGAALHKMAELISPGTPQVNIQVTGSSATLSSSTKHHLLRMAQEAITNAVRHAAAKTIHIILTCEPESVALSITDDGNGFVPAEVLSNGIGHFGLRGLRGRATKIGGEIQILSAPGLGTSIRILVNEAALRSHATVR